MKTAINNTVGGVPSKLKLLKSVVAGCGLLLMLPSAWAQFTWPVYEPFSEYTDGEPLGTNDSLAYWNFGNNGTNGVASYIITNAAAMSFPALVADTNPAPKGVMSQPVLDTSADRGAMFTTHTGTMYASFLLNYIDNGAATITPADRCFFNLVDNAAAGSSDTHIVTSVWLTPDYQIEIDKDYYGGGTFTDPSPVLVTNVSHLIVIRYQVVPGGNDEMDLWIDPVGLGDDGLIPPPTLSTTNGPNVASFNGMMLENRKTPTYTANAFNVDEIRLGDDWASVTPPTASPGPLFGVTGGGTGCAGDVFHVGVSGSVTTNDYLLYTNGVYSGQSLTGSGSALDFGTELAKGTYTVLASNTITADVGWMTNSVFIKITQPPTIVNEPQPAVTTTNNLAEFQVVVTGSGVGYQWYRDNVALTNDSHLTGATTNDLAISPATPADVGNYYCIITNTCGDVVTTTTNSLTLDAPNNLVWSGDAFGINLWAVGMTPVAEFNNNSAYFNEGDNVTFDNSYNGAQYGSTITLSNTLTPTMITYNTSQSLTWAGPGYIAGSGMLLVNGGGILTIANSPANTYTGGTVISNGTVNIHNSWNSLGTGPVTLAGGTLETYQKGNGSSTGLPGDLLVTANSTWQIDRTGNQCAGLSETSALLGNPGTTLTLTNSATQTDTAQQMRFGSPFTNNCAIAVFVNDLATNSQLQIGTYHGSGAEVFNGPISGATALNIENLGSVYLNGANTYTNETDNAFGFLAGSGSISGPLAVDSGGTLGGGSQEAIGTFTVYSDVSLAGNVLIRVDKSLSPAQSNDMISATGIITNTGTGTVTITNIGAMPLAAGDKFKIFSGPVQNGDALTVTGGGVVWSNNLAVDGSVQVVPGPTLITISPAITNFSLEGANAVISGTNGQAGATAYLLMTTNIAEPPNQWKTVATNVLGGSVYTFIGTNVVTAGSPQQFFMLSSTNYNP
jgi:autotransporter-associated beta strand protein